MRGKSTVIMAEWVDEKVHTRRVREAIAAANKKNAANGTPLYDVKKEMDDGYLDWADPENSMLIRKFPSVALAIGWAKKNCGIALWSSVTVVKNEIDHDDYDSETTLERYDIQDGEIVYQE